MTKTQFDIDMDVHISSSERMNKSLDVHQIFPHPNTLERALHFLVFAGITSIHTGLIKRTDKSAVTQSR